MYWAVEKNHASLVKLLLAASADLEAATEEGNTALLRAVKNRNLEIVQLLLDRKAKVTATDKSGDTSLHVAMRARSKAIVELLLRNPKNSQLLYKPNRAGETPYNIDISNQKTILGQVFGARKLNTNEDTENMLGYDLYGSALADILTEPSLSMPITVGLYAKWGSGKSFLLKKLREEMQHFAREWIDPTFHLSPLLFCVVFHVATLLGVFAWIVTSVHAVNNSFLVLLLVTVATMLICYLALFAIWQGTYKSDWYFLYNMNVALARKFNELRLLVNVLFSHPAGPQWVGRQEKAQPLKLFFTDQSKVSTSAGAENSVVQIIGSLYDSLEATYGTFATRLYRAFRPRPVKSSGPARLRKLCCVPYASFYLLSYVLLLAELILIIMKAEGLHRASNPMSALAHPTIAATNITMNADQEEMLEEDRRLDSLVVSLLIALAAILGVIMVANIYTIGQTLKALLFSQRSHLQRAVAKHDMVQSEGIHKETIFNTHFNPFSNRFPVNNLAPLLSTRIFASSQKGGDIAAGDGEELGRLLRSAVQVDRGGGRPRQRRTEESPQRPRHRAHPLLRPWLPVHHCPRHRPPCDHQGHRAEPQPGVQGHKYRGSRLPEEHGAPALLPAERRSTQGQDCPTTFSKAEM